MNKGHECECCMEDVLIQTVERANEMIKKLRAENKELRRRVHDESEQRYELQEQIAELLIYRAHELALSNTDAAQKGVDRGQ